MRVPDDVICKVCKKVFCCAECRYRHAIKYHAIVVRQTMALNGGNHTGDDTNANTNANTSANTSASANAVATIYLFCPICEEQPLPLPLHEELYQEMLDHIQQQHLPLRCRKCAKVYTKIEDLKEFSKCLQPTVRCQDENQESTTSAADQTSATDASKVTVTKAVHRTTISTQTSPMRSEFNDTQLTTPISLINLRWKAKSKITHEEFISDSVSSIRNLSSISNSSIRRSIDIAPKGKGKLVRSTSTPVHAEIFYAKPKEQTFNATGGQVSSIYTSGYDPVDNSPATQLLSPKQQQPLENVNRYFKVGGRTKLSAVTPLRQVMSKSIQKAFAEHGALPPTASLRTHGVLLNGKKMFDSYDSSGHQGAVEHASTPPLDLRLSPAVRRTQDVPQHTQTTHLQPEILLSAQKLTTESIVITRTHHLTSNSGNSTNQSNSSSASNGSCSTSSGGSVYKTCRSVEIITSTTAELSEVSIHPEAKAKSNIQESSGKLCPQLSLTDGSNYLPHVTPITRVPGVILNKKLKFDTPKTASARQMSPSNDDVFFTPNSTPMRKSSLKRSSPESSPTTGDRKCAQPRKLSNRFSPSRRPALRDCTENTAFSRIEDVTEDYDDDEVFLPKVASTKQKLDKPVINDQADVSAPAVKETGRSWSLSSIMSSVMGLSGLKGNTTKKLNDPSTEVSRDHSKSLIRRCSSIAGSMVRTQTLADADQLNTLKRKRTQTMDNQSAYLSQLNSTDLFQANSEHSLALSSKRFRIQGRKPIERMRSDAI